MGNKITPREENYSKWYNDIVSEAGLAESSDVRGCMVIKPYGFSIWELMKSQPVSYTHLTLPTKA